MLEQEKKIQKLKFSEYLSLFLSKLEEQHSRDEIARLVAKIIHSVTAPIFLSYVCKSDDNKIQVVCQHGDEQVSKQVEDLFSEHFSIEMFEWVTKQNKTVSLILADKEKFTFIPLCDQINGQLIKHGLVVIKLQNVKEELNSDARRFIEIVVRLSELSLSRLLPASRKSDKPPVDPNADDDLKLALKLQKAMTHITPSSRLLVQVLEDDRKQFDGNIWWMSELNPDISLLLMAEVNCKSKGIPSAILAGYLLGKMNSLKQQAELSLKPKRVLEFLNNGLQEIYKASAVTINAWYGVINISARKITFANANYPDPYIIGPEQQVSLFKTNKSVCGPSVGLNQCTKYEEDNFYVPVGSKLVICTRSMLEQSAKIGAQYDHKWLPQVLETLGSLSLRDMQMSLKNILSEREQGTPLKPSRLALLLEIPAA